MGQVSTRSVTKEWPMPTFIAVQCPHCHRDQVVKRGKTACGTQRYLCQNKACATGSFLLHYRNRGCLPEVKALIINMSLNARAVYDGAMESSFRYPPHQQLLKRQTVIGETLKHRR